MVTSIAGHFCIDAFKESSRLEALNLLIEVNEAISSQKLNRMEILGTRTVMEPRFYSGIKTAEVVAPKGSALDEVHSAYVSMAAAGQVTSDQRAVFDSACDWFVNQVHVDAIMLGGTDLALVYQEGQTRFPIVDCAAIHVDSIVRHATK